MARPRRLIPDPLDRTDDEPPPPPPSPLPPKQQPPPPLPVLASSPPVSSAEGEHSRHRVTNLLLISAAIFAVSVLLSLVYYAILRRRRRRPVAAPAGAESDEEEDDGLEYVDEGQPFHHVWYIRSVGLDEPTIASIAVAEYRAGDGLLDGVSDCSVCLGEFCDGERVRLLPKCGHAFHIPCIDTWLRAHTNCPLCRAHIVEPEAEPAAEAGALLPIAAVGDSADSESGSSRSAEIRQTGNQPSSPPEAPAAEDEGEPESMNLVATPVDPSQVAGSPSRQEERELQPVRRSISLDAPLMNAIIVRLKPDEEDTIDEEGKDTDFDEENNPRMVWGKQEDPAKEAVDQKGRADIGRSLSSSGRGFFFSRHGRVARIHSMNA